MAHACPRKAPRQLGQASLTAARIALSLAALLALSLAACGRPKGSPSAPPSASSQPDPAKASASAAPPPSASAAGPRETVTIPAVTISPRAETTIHVAWDAPAGTTINDDAPFRVRWTTSEGLAEVPTELRAKGKDVAGGFDVRVVAAKGAPEAHIAGTLELVVCDSATHAVCVPVKRQLEMNFLVDAHTKPRREEARVALPGAR